jgi:predicted deacylase
MAWSDIFLPSGAMTADEQQANLEKQKAVLAAKLEARKAAGTLTPEEEQLYYPSLSVQLEDQNAAAAAGLAEGAKEGLNNVLDAPGWLTKLLGDAASKAVKGIVINIPWWVWVVAAGALFIWMGGLSLLKGRFARQ